MLSRFATLGLAIGGALLLASCSDGEGADAAPFEVIYVAVGAEVTLVLQDDPAHCDDTPETGCLSARTVELVDASLSRDGPFELGEAQLDGGTLRVTVKAVEEGYTILVLDHKDF